MVDGKTITTFTPHTPKKMKPNEIPGIKPYKFPTILPTYRFIQKFSRNVLLGFMAILFSLGIGMVGYHHFENMNWVDAYVNAAMILSGMGPLTPLETTDGKIFAGTYALFSGIFFLFLIAIIFAPILHLFLHRFHMEDEVKIKTVHLDNPFK